LFITIQDAKYLQSRPVKNYRRYGRA